MAWALTLAHAQKLGTGGRRVDPFYSRGFGSGLAQAVCSTKTQTDELGDGPASVVDDHDIPLNGLRARSGSRGQYAMRPGSSSWRIARETLDSERQPRLGWAGAQPVQRGQRLYRAVQDDGG